MSNQDENKYCGCGGGEHSHHHFSQPDKEPLNVNELDAGSRALANALKVSFLMLKAIMLVLVIAFFASGFFTIEQGWQGLVLRFGKIVGQGEERVKNPGLGWCFPSPIDEVIKFPSKQQQTITIDKDFWYFGDEAANPMPTLKPENDGYCITRNESVAGIEGNDYNIVHTKWEIKFHIGDIEKFFKNVYVEKLSPGQSFYDVRSKTVDPYIMAFAGDAIVNTMVKYSIDDALTIGKSAIANDVRKYLISKLDSVQSGIVVDSVLLVGDVKWPRQVEEAFLASTKAAQDAAKEIINAEKYRDNLLNETGGRYAVEIAAAVKDEATTNQEKLQMWINISGKVKQILNEAQTYKTQVVESARANALYLQKLLPEYRQRPELVLQKIYQDALEEILNSTEERIFVQPQSGNKGREIRLMISRDPIKNEKSKVKN